MGFNRNPFELFRELITELSLGLNNPMGMNMRLDHNFLWELDLWELEEYRELYERWVKQIEKLKKK